MLHYSNDTRVNALFLHAECSGELDDCIHALELPEMEDETVPDAYLDAEYEYRYAMYDYEPSPYAGDYSEM
jgi:hypothetical protein